MVIEVSNLKINNVVATGTVKITSPFPTITWEYDLVERVDISDSEQGEIESTFTNSPKGYEIRVGTSSTNHGSSSFSGNLVATGFIEDTRTQWRFRGSTLSRGSTYYGQIRITDSDNNTSSWKTFVFKYNQVPSISSATITPSSPTNHDDLLLSYTWTDSDGDVETGSQIWWFKNGVHERQFDGKSLIESKYLAYGDDWSSQIFPSDGLETGKAYVTSSVTITTETPEVNNAVILPEAPTYNDPLYAKYTFTSPDAKADKSAIRWYVNNVMQSGKDKAFARFETEAGDVVHYEIQPNDGTLSNSWVSSASVTISSPPFVVDDVRCNGELEPLDTSLTPSISWSVSGPREKHSTTRVQIGTAPGSHNVYDSGVLQSDQTVFVVPENVLENGRDYYIAVAVGGVDGVDDHTIAHIRTTGSCWQESVSNSVGWTIETTMKVASTAFAVDSGSSSSSSSSTVSATYQGIRIYDGSKYAEVRFYTDRISVISGTTIEYKVDNTNYAIYTIIGKNNSIKLFRNYQLIIDGTDKFTSSTNTKNLEFGAIGSSPNTLGQYLNFRYTTEGYYDPTTSDKYFDTQYETFLETNGSIDYVSGENTDVYYAVSENSQNSVVYKLSDEIVPELARPARESTLRINAIQPSPNGESTYFCHNNGVTVFENKIIPEYDHSLENQNPTTNGWKLTKDAGNGYTISGGVNITTSDGRLYFSQSEKGSSWFDNVTNNGGWTVAFSMRIVSVKDDSQYSITEKPEGFGLYVNDGRYQEVVHFFTDQILLRNSATYVTYNTTSLTDYVLVGKNRTIKLFAKANGKYRLLAESSLTKEATAEGNGNRPSITEDVNGGLHAVWHDDGGRTRSIYYSYRKAGEKWSRPLKIVDEQAANPNIAVDPNGVVYVAYESQKSDATDISMVVKNALGWSKPFLLDSGLYFAFNPKLDSDSSGNISIVWEDHREQTGTVMYRRRSAATGKWSAAARITDNTIDALRPAISIDGTRLYVSFTSKSSNGSSDIYITTKLDSNASWDVPVKVSTSGKDADYSDVVADVDYAYITWHDNKSGSYEIYARRATPVLSFPEAAQQLTTHAWASKFPSIGLRNGSDANTGNVYVAFESGGDLDYTNGTTEQDYTISVAYYRNSIDRWLGSNQTHTVGPSIYGGLDVVISPNDLRQSRRPAIAKKFAGDAHILYEMEYATDDDEYLLYTEKFAAISDVRYDLTYGATYSIFDVDVDLKVSGQVERKEIRFGDFSDNYSGAMKVGYIKYLSEAVEPFDATLLLKGTTVNDASVNDNGDGWIASQSGLSFYFNRDNRVAKFAAGLFGQGPVSDVAFDHNNIMYVVAAGRIYISHDHLNFYQAFTFVTNAKSIAFDSQNYLWVASESGAYKVDVWSATSGMPRDGISVPQPPPSSSTATSSSSSGTSGGGVAAGNEIKSTLTKDKTYYAFVLDPSLKVWNTVSKEFENSTTAHWAQYVIPMTQLGIPGTYAADFPTAITAPNVYFTYIYLQNGGAEGNTIAPSPTPLDTLLQQGDLDWDGEKERGYVPPSNTGGGTDPVTPPDAVIVCEENSTLGYTSYNTGCGLPSNSVRQIYVDALDQVWLATSGGLAMIRGKRITSYTTDNSALPSDDVTDIAIVNSAIRYVGTSSGLVRMFGNAFERISFGETDWSDDISAIAWRSPNTLWIGASDKIIQLTRDTLTGAYKFVAVPASEFADYATVCKNSQKFTFGSLDQSYLLQVFVNGRLVENGYSIGGNSLFFDAPLLDSDRVEISVRKDITKWATLEQNKAERLVYGDVYRKMKKFVVNGTDIYGITDGDKNQIVAYDSSETHTLPYDSIVYDSTPPVGQLEFVEQIDGSIVKLKIVNAFDNLSGLKNMKVSNYENLSSDGENPLAWVPYKDTFEFDLGDDLGNIFTQTQFTDTQGKRLAKFKSDVYAGTESPARVYKYNTVNKVWDNLATLGVNATVEFMLEYKNAFYVGTNSGNVGTLWSSADGSNWTKQIDYPGRAYAATTLNNMLYVGTDGEDGGQLFTFDGVNSNRIANRVGAKIYALHGAKNSVYIGTGESGILYRWDTIVNRLILVVHDRDSSISAIGSALINPATADTTNPDKDFYLFAGTGTKGRIIKSINGSPFNISFTSLPTKVSQIKLDADDQLHAVVGKNVYKYKNRSWAAVFTNTTDIQDIYFDQTGFTLITSSGIKRINNEKGVKKIYLGLQDVAGNASEVGTSIEVDINDLIGFVNENRILELNEYGERVWNYDGDESFYSADKVVEEQAFYFSEVFNGTSDHVSWDTIYWDAVVPTDTDLNISVRTGDTRDQLLAAKFSKTFSKEQFEGGDISQLSGQFIQFKVTLSTKVRGKSPKLYRINIRSRTRTAVHFFTTNFVLPSNLKGGLITAQTFVPFAADIVFGINTNNSVDWSDYQTVKLNQLFAADEKQLGKNLRIGVKFISPLNVTVSTDPLEEYSPYFNDLWNNVIPFTFTNNTGSSKNYLFKVELFEEPEMVGDAFTTLYTATTPEAFNINGTIADDAGITLANGQTATVLVALKGNATIRCNEYYYTKISAVAGNSTTIIDDSHAFIANCSVNYANSIGLDFTNETGSSGAFGFRAMFYADATRTTHIKTYFSEHDQAGWLINGSLASESGNTIASGQTVTVEFTPPQGDLTEDNYFLVIDYYDGTNFYNITKSPTIAITSESEYSCGEYVNVPILKDMAIQIEIDEFIEEFGGRERPRRTYNFNI